MHGVLYSDVTLPLAANIIYRLELSLPRHFNHQQALSPLDESNIGHEMAKRPATTAGVSLNGL